MAEKFLLKDHLFNAETVGQLAHEFAQGVPGFDAERFVTEALSGFPERELLARLEWLADCAEHQLAPDFPTMADQLEAAMPPELDPTLKDDDFGHFIHAVPGILTVRHGLDAHLDRALELLHKATRRFSMEFYIRPFINRWKEPVMGRLSAWVEDENYHVRRLVSEGTRPKLPWAKSVDLTPDETFPLLEKLHADGTRYVTRSVANHLNDISKIRPDDVVDSLSRWKAEGRQTAKEIEWMTRHALRSLIKEGHRGAMQALGYRDDLDIEARLQLWDPVVKIGETLEFEAQLVTPQPEPVLIDYQFWTTKADGQMSPKVFKLKTTKTKANETLTIRKSHKLKADATTFKLLPGPAKLALQVNGKVACEVEFNLRPSEHA